MKRIILTAIIVAGSIGLFAQPLPPYYGGTHGQSEDAPAAAPIDGGLSILLVLGAAFGTKKIHQLRKKAIKEI